MWVVAAVVIAGFLLVLALDRPALRATLAALGHIGWGWVLLGLLAEAASMLSAAAGHRRLLGAGGDRIRLRAVLAVAYAGTAIASSVPFAGTQMAAAYSFRQYHRRGVGWAVAGWALAVAWMFATLSFAMVLAVGAATSGDLVAAGAGLATSVVFLLPPVLVFLALRYPGVRHRITGWADALVVGCRRLTGRPGGDPMAALGEILDRMAGLRLPARSSVPVFVAYLGNWVGDIACFACAIRAVGLPVPWHGLLLAYGAGITADSLGLTPGGLGVVEAALSAALVASGLHAGVALSAVLVYRLMSFWLLLAVGWVVMVFLSRVPRVPMVVSPDPQPAPAPAGSHGSHGLS